uniref:Calmodulin n=1 Tax=Rhabditophanes sp. KR3021 TaxID=114890 RepID=A0AC35TUG7_9BILA
MGCCVTKDDSLKKKTKNTIAASTKQAFSTPKDANAMKEIEALFEKFDLDNNGIIDRDELRKVMTAMDGEVTESEIDSMFLVADTNKDGKIDLHEFKDLIWANNDVLSIQTTFKTLDSNHDGYITTDDLDTALSTSIINKEIYNSVNHYLQQNGALSFSEFYGLMPKEHIYLL